MVTVIADNPAQVFSSMVMVQVGPSIRGSDILPANGTEATLILKDLLELLNGDAVILLEIEILGMSLLLVRIKGGHERLSS
jgi:hypothetical protein